MARHLWTVWEEAGLNSSSTGPAEGVWSFKGLGEAEEITKAVHWPGQACKSHRTIMDWRPRLQDGSPVSEWGWRGDGTGGHVTWEKNFTFVHDEPADESSESQPRRRND